MADEPDEFEVMFENDDGWCDWVHPMPGYRIKCCGCGLVHHMEFEIVRRFDDAPMNPGESKRGVIVFRAKREQTNTP